MNNGFGSFRRRRFSFAVWSGILFLLLSYYLCTAQSSDRRIIFKPGQTKAQVTGRFSKAVHEVYFSFYANADQHVLVRITPTTPQLVTAGVVIYPSGKQDGGPGGIVFDSDLTESGEYRLRVTPRQSQAEGTGKFLVLVEILSASKK